MKKVAMFLVDEFEDSEALVVRDLLLRAELKVDSIALFETKTITSAHGLTIQADYLFDEVKLGSYDAYFLPGGKGTVHYYLSNALHKRLEKALAQHKLIAAICAAPSYLAGTGLLSDYKATCYPTYEKELLDNDVILVKDKVVVDDNIITGQAMGSCIEFGLAMIEYLCGKEKMKGIAKSICF